VQISETPNTGWVFVNWTCTGTGCYYGKSSTAIIKIVSPITETADYTLS
jgi:hypothetical protein